MNNCSQCGSSIPSGQSICSMCMGDISHGSDGYYLEWAQEELQKEKEQEEINNYILMMEELIKEINELDYAYEMSDDHDLYITESTKKASIEFRLGKLSNEELTDIETRLDVVGKANWKRYFQKQLV